MSAAGRTIVILGTARGVGKTLIARGILERVRSLGHRSIGIVPIETGCTYGENHDLIGRDGMALRASSSGPVPPLVTTPYRFAAEGNPADVAAKAGLELTLEDLSAAIDAAAEFGTFVVVEGPHTAMTPLVEGKLTIDLASHLNAPAFVVSRGLDDAAALYRECEARGVKVSEAMGMGNVPPNLEVVKALLETQRMVERIIEAMRPA